MGGIVSKHGSKHGPFRATPYTHPGEQTRPPAKPQVRTIHASKHGKHAPSKHAFPHPSRDGEAVTASSLERTETR